MADQLRWWKLWTSALDDEKLEALSLENWARWARLGAWLKVHGEHGSAVVDLSSPASARSILRVLRVSSKPSRAHHQGGAGGDFRGTHVPPRVPLSAPVVSVLQSLPGVGLQWEDEGRGLLRITVKKWKKYQEDDSRDRVRAYRDRRRQRNGEATVTGNDDSTVTGNGVRRDETRTPKPPSASPLKNGEEPEPAFRVRDSMLNLDCPDARWRTGLCVKTEYLDRVPNPRQCPHHKALHTSAGSP